MSALTDGLAFILSWEAGYVNDPDDSGGPTNRGITQRTYDAWLASHGLPSADVKTITNDEAIDIYTSRFWNVFDGDRVAALCPNLAIVMADSAVQHGPRWAVVTLQRVVGSEIDGRVGPATLMALKLALVQKGATLILTGFLNQRKAYYQHIIARKPSQEKFRRGWSRRLNDLCRLVGLKPIWEAAA